jgi:putative transposase
MMATYTQIIYHLVFATKDRRPILKGDRKELYQYIWGILKKKECHLYRIGGVEDHLHILTSLHPSIGLADLIKDIKLASSKWIKEGGAFPGFDHWQDGYGAFTCSSADKDRIIEYIKNQENHHPKQSSREELAELLKEAGVTFDEKYFG